MSASDLYDRDFVLWTQTQAEALRAASARGRDSNAIEWERVAEEVEDMGKSQVQAAESLLLQVLVHLYKLASTLREEPKGHWEAECLSFRAALRRKLTPTIRRVLEEELETMHAEAAEIAARAFKSDEPQAAIRRERRWSLEQALGEEDDPLKE